MLTQTKLIPSRQELSVEGKFYITKRVMCVSYLIFCFFGGCFESSIKQDTHPFETASFIFSCFKLTYLFNRLHNLFFLTVQRLALFLV